MEVFEYSHYLKTFRLGNDAGISSIYDICSNLSESDVVLFLKDNYVKVYSDDVIVRKFLTLSTGVLCSSYACLESVNDTPNPYSPYPVPRLYGIIGFSGCISELFIRNGFLELKDEDRTEDKLVSWILNDSRIYTEEVMLDSYGFIFGGNFVDLESLPFPVDSYSSTCPCIVDFSLKEKESSIYLGNFPPAASLYECSFFGRNFGTLFSQEEFDRIIPELSGMTMMPQPRLFTVFLTVKTLVNHDIPGDFVEIGCWRGGCSRLISYACGLERKLWAFDTFTGYPYVSEQDSKHYQEGMCLATEETVRNYLADRPNIEIVKGVFPESVRGLDLENKNIAFAHVDCNLYEGTKDSIEFIYPRLSKNGVIIFDDYPEPDNCSGVYRAVEEFKDKYREFLICDSVNKQGIMVKTRD